MGTPGSDTEMSQADRDRMAENAARASNFLKAISHEGRLMILCHLSAGEKSVTELEELLSARQTARRSITGWPMTVRKRSWKSSMICSANRTATRKRGSDLLQIRQQPRFRGE